MARGPDSNFWYTEANSFIGQAVPISHVETFVLGTNQSADASGTISVLANGGDQAQIISSTAHGALTLNSDGTFTYTPNPSFQGLDRFTYQESGNGAPGTATATLLSYRASLVDKLYYSHFLMIYGSRMLLRPRWP